jgi:hypothetical protein
MRKFITCSVLATLATLASISLSSTAASASFNATGTYCVQATGNQFTKGLIHMTQTNSTIVGSYGHGGQLSATLNGTVADAKWKDQRGAGWATLNFTPAGRDFSGSWGYNGRKAEGDIVATRIAAGTTNAAACQ